MTAVLLEHVESRIHRSPDGCWIWTGTLDRTGYGRLNVGRHDDGRRLSQAAHRFVWEQTRGPIEPGLVLDHRCRTRACVNPDHLEPVEHLENLRRGARKGRSDHPSPTYRRRYPRDPATPWERLWRRVLVMPDGCWLWQGAQTTGYGSAWNGVRTVLTHRWVYERLVGPVPEGLVLDHLCRVRNCVNVLHLEPVTSGENTRRGPGSVTHCSRGHLLPPRTTTGPRRCRPCAAITFKAWSTGPGADKVRANSRRRQERRRKGCGPGAFNRAKTHCPQGHPYDAENTAIKSDGRRVCRACGREYTRRRREARKVAV